MTGAELIQRLQSHALEHIPASNPASSESLAWLRGSASSWSTTYRNDRDFNEGDYEYYTSYLDRAYRNGQQRLAAEAVRRRVDAEAAAARRAILVDLYDFEEPEPENENEYCDCGDCDCSDCYPDGCDCGEDHE